MVKKAPHMVKMTPPPKKKKKGENVSKKASHTAKKMFLIFQGGGAPPADVHVQASNLNQKIKVISICLLELW